MTPPSALARNASGSNLAFDFFATAESPCAPTSRTILSPPAPRRQACLGPERAPKNRKGRDRFESVQLLRLFARRTTLQHPPLRSSSARLASAVSTRLASRTA